MEDQTPELNAGADISVAVITTPSVPLTTFDVNKFLKKTFSDYDIERTRRNSYQETPAVYDKEQRQDEQEAADIAVGSSGDRHRRTHHRRAGSVPTTSKDRGLQTYDCRFYEASASMEPFADQDEDRRRRIGGRKTPNRRSRLRDKDERCQLQYVCAYCGQEVYGRVSANSARSLYCAACTSFFTRHSPTELQRRIAYDEMTVPSADYMALPVPIVGTSSGITVDHTETAPLLVDSNKVVIVSSDSRDAECENSECMQNEHGQQGPEEVEEIFRHRYARNDRPHGRGHGGRLQMKVRQSQHRQQPQRGRSGQALSQVDASSKTSSWLSDSAAPVVIWNKDNYEQYAGSRRSSLTSASSLNRPTCRICHLYGEPGDTLISPCRCAGTMQYVHTSCLVHWLEISTKKVLPYPHCELCGYHYRTHHCYRFTRMHAPTCNHRDRILHVVFVIMLFMMIGCAALSAVYLRQDKGSVYRRASLNSDDIIVIASALLFFCAFFVAVFTQYRAETSVCRLCLRCWLINRHWRVKDYDRRFDSERRSKFGHSVVMEQV